MSRNTRIFNSLIEGKTKRKNSPHSRLFVIYFAIYKIEFSLILRIKLSVAINRGLANKYWNEACFPNSATSFSVSWKHQVSPKLIDPEASW